jgi:hypothetical protein
MKNRKNDNYGFGFLLIVLALLAAWYMNERGKDNLERLRAPASQVIETQIAPVDTVASVLFEMEVTIPSYCRTDGGQVSIIVTPVDGGFQVVKNWGDTYVTETLRLGDTIYVPRADGACPVGTLMTAFPAGVSVQHRTLY